ncbi:MAG: hypothetical protein ABSE73_26480, partial [Planctomycetota bacterium]
MDSRRETQRGWAFGLVLVLACGGCAERQNLGDPEQQVAAGWEAYRLGEFNRALSAFEAAARAPAKSDARLRGLYGLATTWNLRRPDDDPAKAEALFRSVLAEAPDHDLAAWSLLALARMKHLVPVGTDPDYAAVRRAYEECIARFPNHLAGEEAFIYLQSTFVATLSADDARQAAAALERFLAERPGSAFSGLAFSLLAQCYGTLRQPEKLLATMIKAVEAEERDPLNPNQDKALGYWRIGTIAEFEAGDFDTARKYY